MKIFSYFFLCLFKRQISVSGNELGHNPHEMNQRTSDSISKFVKQDLSHLVWKAIHESDRITINISSNCVRDVKSLSTDISSNLGTKFSGHFPSRFNQWIYSDFGDYDGCIGASSFGFHDFHHCVMSLEPEFRKYQSLGVSNDLLEELIPFDFDAQYGQSLKIGLCVPRSCSGQDIDFTLEHALTSNQIWRRNAKTQCREKKNLLQRYQLSTIEQKISIWILTVLIFSILWAAFRDWNITWNKSNKNIRVGMVYDVLSPRKTLKDFFSQIGGKRWIFLDQIRLGQVKNVMIFHSILWPGFLKWFSLIGLKNLKSLSGSLWFQPFINSFYFESVIMLGGISSTIVIWKKFSKELSVKTCLWLIIDKFLRFQGIFLALILIKIILPVLDQGPVYDYFMQDKSQICVDNFLFTLLHLTNLIDPQNICLQHMWTFPVEFQLFVVAVLFLYLVRKGFRIRYTVCLQAIVLLFIYTISVFYDESIIPIMIVHPIKANETYNFFRKFYTSTLTHAWSYAGSVLVTLLISEGYDRRFSPIKIRKIAKILIMATMLALFDSYLFTYTRPTSLISATYIGVHYILFSSMIVFVLFSRADDCRACLDLKDSNADLTNTTVNRNNDNNIRPNNECSTKENINEKIAQNQSRDIYLENTGKKHFPWLDVALKLTRNAYYVHDLVIMWTFAKLREPIEFITSDHIYLVIRMIGTFYIVGFLFQIFVVGPSERIHSKIMRLISRKVLKTAL